MKEGFFKIFPLRLCYLMIVARMKEQPRCDAFIKGNVSWQWRQECVIKQHIYGFLTIKGFIWNVLKYMQSEWWLINSWIVEIVASMIIESRFYIIDICTWLIVIYHYYSYYLSMGLERMISNSVVTMHGMFISSTR